MFEVREKPDLVERAMLVGFCFDKSDEPETQKLLIELEELVDTLEIGVVGMELVRIRDKNKRFICGTGKADELVELARARDCDCIVIDNELSPMQQRNWESLADLTIIDREEVILDIFAKRARTKEARLQVDLARMQYALPRMARMWGHLDREGGGGSGGGGGAARGMGEQQIEIDRRLARKRISSLKSQLEDVRKQRATQRKERQKADAATAAIVGYTNAGKSTLLNKISGADVMEADMLFATLDPTTRRIELEDGQVLLLSDTVGFVRNLPHRLVESFKATLEAILADFLIHVLDATSNEVFEHYETTRKVLGELGADEKRSLVVLNKIDRVEDEGLLADLRARFPDALEASAVTGEGLVEVVAKFAEFLSDRVVRLNFRIPQARGDISGLIHREGKVISTDYEGNDVLLTAVVSKDLAGRVAEFQI